jgi:RNA polymerase sigma-70 factor (sigma-E family)
MSTTRAPLGLPADRTAAVTVLFRTHYAPLVRMSRLLVDDVETAEDVVMEAFTALYRRWSSVRDHAEAYRYLRSCVLNGTRSQLRRRQVRRAHDRRPPLPRVGVDPAEAGTDRAAVLARLRRLPLRQRQVLVLRFYLDLTETQIAEELQIGVGSVKTHMARGMAALAPGLEVKP